jgi:hypothetical protein
MFTRELLTMKFLKHFSLLFAVLLSVSGCSLFAPDAYQAESRKVIDYLLSDMPLPQDAEIQKTPTVILGTGTGIAGRIVLNSPVSPASNLIFYGESTVGTGWTLISSTVGDEIILTYTKDGRYATIEILRSKGPGFLGGESSSVITISVVHPSAIQEQNPYAALSDKFSTDQIAASD